MTTLREVPVDIDRAGGCTTVALPVPGRWGSVRTPPAAPAPTRNPEAAEICCGSAWSGTNARRSAHCLAEVCDAKRRAPPLSGSRGSFAASTARLAGWRVGSGGGPGAAALLVFVVACANTVVLLIWRSVLRRREFAVRFALGSGTARLARAALVEGLALAAGGLILGLAVAWVGPRLFAAASARLVPGADVVAIERPVSCCRAGTDRAGRGGMRRRVRVRRREGGERHLPRGHGGNGLAYRQTPAGRTGGRPDRAVHRAADRRGTPGPNRRQATGRRAASSGSRR